MTVSGDGEFAVTDGNGELVIKAPARRQVDGRARWRRLLGGGRRRAEDDRADRADPRQRHRRRRPAPQPVHQQRRADAVSRHAGGDGVAGEPGGAGQRARARRVPVRRRHQGAAGPVRARAAEGPGRRSAHVHAVAQGPGRRTRPRAPTSATPSTARRSARSTASTRPAAPPWMRRAARCSTSTGNLFQPLYASACGGHTETAARDLRRRRTAATADAVAGRRDPARRQADLRRRRDASSSRATGTATARARTSTAGATPGTPSSSRRSSRPESRGSRARQTVAVVRVGCAGRAARRRHRPRARTVRAGAERPFRGAGRQLDRQARLGHPQLPADPGRRSAAKLGDCAGDGARRRQEARQADGVRRRLGPRRRACASGARRAWRRAGMSFEAILAHYYPSAELGDAETGTRSALPVPAPLPPTGDRRPSRSRRKPQPDSAPNPPNLIPPPRTNSGTRAVPDRAERAAGAEHAAAVPALAVLQRRRGAQVFEGLVRRLAGEDADARHGREQRHRERQIASGVAAGRASAAVRSPAAPTSSRAARRRPPSRPPCRADGSGTAPRPRPARPARRPAPRPQHRATRDHSQRRHAERHDERPERRQQQRADHQRAPPRAVDGEDRDEAGRDHRVADVRAQLERVVPRRSLPARPAACRSAPRRRRSSPSRSSRARRCGARGRAPRSCASCAQSDRRCACTTCGLAGHRAGCGRRGGAPGGPPAPRAWSCWPRASR